jgi:NAD(P)-dependent dehydrogenase (short-subunit alcohol dehydrogenase family)
MPRPLRVTSTDYAHPHRPAALRLYNLAAGHAPLEVDRLLEAARAATGLDDFGDPAFREPLGRLVASIEREARLHPVGRSITRTRLVSLLANRLRVEALHRAHPEIDAIPAGRPIVIAGLQRTGTTLLHRLLAADPRARALLSWEALHPAPLPGEGRRGSFRRRAEARLAEVALRAMAPDFFAIHPVEADAPEEDVLLLDHVFTSQTPEATLHVPAYASWLEDHDHTASYRYVERLLKVLLWQRPRSSMGLRPAEPGSAPYPASHWVLKTPAHMEHLGALLAVFPGALIVHTHRDPQATTASFCSMVAHGRGIFSDAVDPREIGRHWLRKVRRMTDRALAVRDGGAGASFVDVSYYDLLADPIAEVRRIYARAGLTLDPAAEAAMRAASGRDVQHRFGRHVYHGRDFGLSRAGIDEAFAAYRARFGIRHEKAERDDRPASQAGPSGVGHRSVIAATATALADMRRRERGAAPLSDADRLDGKTALVTGASAGLGKAVAIDLARRGARLVLACRSGIPACGEEIAARSGTRLPEMIEADLSDFDQVVALADAVERRGEPIDLLCCNAGLVPSTAQRTKQGHEAMFTVHYLASHLLARRLLARGVIPNAVWAGNGRAGTAIPRIVFVSSEAHRSADPLDLEAFGAFHDYALRDALRWYAYSKLALTTFATELARRLTLPGGPSVGVHALCPGPVATSIARSAPPLMQAPVGLVMRTFFPSPEAAAAPVVYLAAAPELGGETGWYMHRMVRKAPSPEALDPDKGRRLWEKGEALIAPWLEAGSIASR